MFEFLKMMMNPEQSLVEWMIGMDQNAHFSKHEFVDGKYKETSYEEMLSVPNYSTSCDYVKRVFEYAINNPHTMDSLLAMLEINPSNSQFMILFQHKNHDLFGFSESLIPLPIKKHHHHIVKLNQSQLIYVIIMMHLRKNNLTPVFQQLQIASIDGNSYRIISTF